MPSALSGGAVWYSRARGVGGRYFSFAKKVAEQAESPAGLPLAWSSGTRGSALGAAPHRPVAATAAALPCPFYATRPSPGTLYAIGSHPEWQVAQGRGPGPGRPYPAIESLGDARNSRSAAFRRWAGLGWPAREAPPSTGPSRRPLGPSAGSGLSGRSPGPPVLSRK